MLLSRLQESTSVLKGAPREHQEQASVKLFSTRLTAIESAKDEGNALSRATSWASAVQKYGEALDVYVCFKLRCALN